MTIGRRSLLASYPKKSGVQLRSQDPKKIYPDLNHHDSDYSHDRTFQSLGTGEYSSTEESLSDGELQNTTIRTNRSRNSDEDCVEQSRTISEDLCYPYMNVYVVLGLALVVFLTLVSFLMPKNATNMSSFGNLEGKIKYEGFVKSLKPLIQNSYPNLSQQNKNILKLMGKKVYLESDESPLVIVISGSESEKLARELSKCFQSSSQNSAIFDTTIRISADSNRAQLHNDLRGILGDQMKAEKKPMSAVVTGIENLQWDAVLVLHAFADHLSYSVPHTVLLLTIDDDSEISGDPENCDENSTRYLKERWIENGGSVDNIPPIIARLGYFMCI